MPLSIRPVVAEEFEAWVAATHVAFHVEPAGLAAEEAVARRDVIQQDLSRTLATFDDQRVAGTLFSFPAELALPGGTHLSADAITSATVIPPYRRSGVLTRMLETDLRAARDRGETAAILVAAEYPIYGRFGFGPAVEHATYTLRPTAATFMRAASGTVDLVTAATLRTIAPAIFDRSRRDRPGQIDRSEGWWDLRLGLKSAPWIPKDRVMRCAVFTDAAGDIQGYLHYRVDGHWEQRLPEATLEIRELMALTDDAYLGLWRYCCELDLVRTVTAAMRCVDEPLPWLLDNPRAAIAQTLRSDLLWLRPLDVPGVLSARRYLTEDRLVFEVTDPLGMSGGRFALDGGPDGATCRPSDASADLSVSLSALGAIALGGVSLGLLAAAGAIEEHRPGALLTGERLFRWPVTPWCSTFF
jgi:predicted acetyltransferase